MEKNELKLGGVLDFWFKELSSEDWFEGGAKLDEKIKKRFSAVHSEIAAGEYWKYRTTGQSLLAEVIVLDQFSRHMFRDSAQAFAYDQLALALAQQAIAAGFDTLLNDTERRFLYMPFMHSESKVIHKAALVLFKSLEDPMTLKFEKIHKAIIDEFGRYPHRNKTLGRKSTPAEVKYLAENHEDFF